MNDYPAFRVSTSSEFQSLLKLLGDVPTRNEDRLAVFVHVQVPANSTARVDPSYDCQFMYFLDVHCTADAFVNEARTQCANQHNIVYQRERHSIMRESREVSPAAMRRCCQIRSSASKWIFYDRTTHLPLLPPCTCTVVQEESPSVGSTNGNQTEKDKHTLTNDISCEIEEHVEHERDTVNAIIHYHRPDDADRIEFMRSLPDFTRLSHFGRLCLQHLEDAAEQLAACVVEQKNAPEHTCAACIAAAGQKRPPASNAQFCRADRLCKICLDRLQDDIKHVAEWARTCGVVCSGRSECACVYNYALRTSGAVIRLDAVVDPTDTVYEWMHDSIYDARSPLLASMIADNKLTGDGMLQRVTTRSKLMRASDSEMAVVRGGTARELRSYSFGERLSYDDMLREARRVYAQPDAATLGSIAVLNERLQPLLGDTKSLRDAQRWLHPYITRRFEARDAAWLRARARNSVATETFILAPDLERLVYADIACAPNCRLAFSRFATFIVPPPNTSRHHRSSSVYFAALLALVNVCETTAEIVQEESAARVISQLKIEAQLLQQRQLTHRKQQEHTKRHRAASQRTQAGTAKKHDNSPPSKKKTLYNSQRVLAHSREPRIGYERDVVQTQQKQIELSIKHGSKQEPLLERIDSECKASSVTDDSFHNIAVIINANTIPTNEQLPVNEQPPILQTRIVRDAQEYVPLRRRCTPSPHVVCGIIANDHCTHLLGSDLFSTIFSD